MYLSKQTIKNAIYDLRGTANHLIKIWFVLKAMGMDSATPVDIDTSNSTPYLKMLFSCGAPDDSFYIPFSHTLRFAFAKNDASRSIIQTTIQRWASSGSVVTCDPSEYLDIRTDDNDRLTVRPGRQYPLGLGYGPNGFALKDEARTIIPDLQFAIWVFAQKGLSTTTESELLEKMIELLHLSPAELETVFIKKPIDISYQDEPVSDSELYDICKNAFNTSFAIEEMREEQREYIKRVKNMVTITDMPRWMQVKPTSQLEEVVAGGEKSILLYGPPRTGKTRAVDQLFPRSHAERVTIQLHEGWGYENLIVGLYPTEEVGKYIWKDGSLFSAIKEGKKYIVLEEINRTRISQVMGEAFSLIENNYRGEENSISLPDGQNFWIPEDVIIFFTMNTIDASTEDIDDALIGRMASVWFPPRIEDLNEMLTNNGISAPYLDKIKELFNAIQANYPLGHGYFAGYRSGQKFKLFYATRIRPVLANHFESYSPEIIGQIDNLVDTLFSDED